MTKLDQKIQEINTEILALNSKKCKLLAIKFDAKGGEGSGRYPAGSSETSREAESSGGRMVSGSSVSSRVGRLAGMEKPLPKINTDKSSESDTKENLASRAVNIGGVTLNDGDPMDGSQLTANTAVNQVQETFGMHPADLRGVILSGLSSSPKTEIDFDVTNDGLGNSEIRVTMDDQNVSTDLTFLLDGRSNAVNPISLAGTAKVPRSAVGSNSDKENRQMNEKLTANITEVARAIGAKVTFLTKG